MAEQDLLKQIKKKAFIDLVASPYNLGPMVGGLTFSLACWTVGSLAGAFVGLMSFGVGTGILFTRFLFNLESITQKAYEEVERQKEEVQRQKEKEFNDSLDQLDRLLCRDKDPRPENCLRELRVLYAELKEEFKIKPRCAEILTNFEQLFNACVKRLQETNLLWESGQKLSGTARRNIVDKREKIVIEVERMTQEIAGDIRQFKTIIVDEPRSSELLELQKELEMNLRIHRKANEQLNEFKNKFSNLDKE